MSSRIGTSNDLSGLYPGHPHSSKNVNNIHHTACRVRSDATTLDLNIRRRRPGKYDVPLTSQSLVKLNDSAISNRLRERICSASRVYCGNNMLNLHRHMYLTPRPASVQYKWSPPKVPLALPKVEKEHVRARTAGVMRFRNLDPILTSTEKKRPHSFQVIAKTKEPEEKQQLQQKHTLDEDNDNTYKHGANEEDEQDPATLVNKNSSPERQDNHKDSDGEGSVQSGTSNGKVEREKAVKKKKTKKREKDSDVEGSSISGSVQSGTSNGKVEKEKKREKDSPGQGDVRNQPADPESAVKPDAKEIGNAWFSKRRGLNSDDDYSSDSSEDSNDEPKPV